MAFLSNIFPTKEKTPVNTEVLVAGVGLYTIMISLIASVMIAGGVMGIDSALQSK